MYKKFAALLALILLGMGLSAATAPPTSPLRERFGNCHSSPNLLEYLYAAYAARRGNLDYLLIDGDSLMKGQGAALGINLPVQLAPLLAKPVVFENISICGLQLAEMKVRAGVVPPPSHPKATHRILIEDGGSNDLGSGITGERLFHEIFLPYVAMRKAQGFKEIIAATVIYRDDFTPAENAERESYNTLLRAGAASYGYAVVDYDSIPQLRNPQSPGYSSDGRHPTLRGYGLMAAKIAPVVNKILLSRDVRSDG